MLNGKSDYLQIMSEDSFSTNIVIVAEEIIVTDSREVAENKDR